MIKLIKFIAPVDGAVFQGTRPILITYDRKPWKTWKDRFGHNGVIQWSYWVCLNLWLVEIQFNFLGRKDYDACLKSYKLTGK